LIRSNKISGTFLANDISKSTDVIIDVSLRGKKKYNQNMVRNKDDNVGYIRSYDEIFDFDLRGNRYTCVVLECKIPSLDEFAKNGIKKNVYFLINILSPFRNS
jgi:carbamoylphosphate synthase large subunit